MQMSQVRALVAQPLYMKMNTCTECNRQFKAATRRGKYCPSCHVTRCRRRTKLKAIEYKGGKCQTCGYNKSIRALTFHHLDPNEKDIAIADSSNRSFSKVKAELDKCVLLCANCHAEEHEKIEKEKITSRLS